MPGPDGGESARAVPGRAQHHADGGEFVFRLDDGVAGFLVSAVGPVARAIACERFGERGRRRDRIPGADGRAAIDGAERSRGIAFDEDAIADGVDALARAGRAGR